jgi:hypothetical protein
MSNRRKLKRRRDTRSQRSRLRVVARRRTVESQRRRRLHAVRPYPDDYDARAIRVDVPAIPETATRGIHVLCVSLYGATPPPFRLLEVASAMTLDQLHRVVQRTFEWWEPGPYSFVTIYGEFFGLKGPVSRAAGQAGEPRDASRVTLAQTAGEQGLGIVYLFGYHDQWQVHIKVEKILPAAAGVAYPRCTGGRGVDIPGERYHAISEFNTERWPTALDFYFDPEDLTDDLADLATVIVPASRVPGKRLERSAPPRSPSSRLPGRATGAGYAKSEPFGLRGWG